MRDHSYLRQHCVPQYIIVWTGIYFLPLSLFAQDETGSKPSTALAIFFSVLPIVLIGALLFWFFRKVQGKNQKHVDRHREHMDRVEQSLDRIATALERKS